MLTALLCFVLGFYASYILCKIFFDSGRSNRWLAATHLIICSGLILLSSFIFNTSEAISSGSSTPILNGYVVVAFLGALFHWYPAYFGWDYKEWQARQRASQIIGAASDMQPYWHQDVRDAAIVEICRQMLLNWQDPAPNQALLCSNEKLAVHIKQTLDIAGHRAAAKAIQLTQPIQNVIYDLVNANPAEDIFTAQIKEIQFDYSDPHLERPKADFLELFEVQLTLRWQQNTWQLSDITSVLVPDLLDEQALGAAKQFAQLHGLSYAKRGYGRSADASSVLADYIGDVESAWPYAHMVGRLHDLPAQLCVARYGVGWKLGGVNSPTTSFLCIHGRIVLAQAMPAFLLWRSAMIDTRLDRPTGYDKADITSPGLSKDFQAYAANSQTNAARKMNELLTGQIAKNLLAEPGRVYLDVEGPLASIYIERDKIDSHAFEDLMIVLSHLADWSKQS